MLFQQVCKFEDIFTIFVALHRLHKNVTIILYETKTNEGGFYYVKHKT